MRRPIAKLCLLIGFATLVFAAYTAWRTHQYRQKLDAWRDAVLLERELSLTDLAEHSGPLTHSCLVSHGQVVKLEVFDASNVALVDFPREMDYDCRLHPANEPDKVTDLLQLSGGWIGPGSRGGPDGHIIAQGHFGPPGDYCLSFKLNKPIDMPGAARARLVVRNAFCGCEYLGPFFGNVIAAVAALVGFAFAIPSAACIFSRPPTALPESPDPS